MKINEVIRQRRKELGLTQERVAELLGVSAPAVNKWENGNSYPDITLLPPLARLLKTDLNTLLSVSYTHLDVYKRQRLKRPVSCITTMAKHCPSAPARRLRWTARRST